MDLETAVETTLIDCQPTRVPTTAKGPLLINGSPVGALLLGRSSSGLRGLTVLPGLIDADYEGIIQLVIQTQFPPLHIPAGSRVAQIIPLPHLLQDAQPLSDQPRRSKGFGSTGGLALLTVPMKQRPVVSAILYSNGHQCTIRALLDTGADVTIVAQHVWPSQWPLERMANSVEGVGGTMPVSRSSDIIQVTIDERFAHCHITVMPLPIGVNALIGRDVLDQLGMVLTTSTAPFS